MVTFVARKWLALTVIVARRLLVGTPCVPKLRFMEQLGPSISGTLLEISATQRDGLTDKLTAIITLIIGLGSLTQATVITLVIIALQCPHNRTTVE